MYELAHPETYLRPVRPLAEIHALGAVGGDRASSAQRLADLTSIASSAGIEVIELDIDQPSTPGIIDLIVVLDRRSETAAGRLAAKEGIPLLRLPGGHIPCGLPLLLKGAFVREFPVLNVRGIGTVPQIAVASARVEARGHDAELIPKLEGIRLMPPVSFLCAQGPAPFGGPTQREVRAVGFESMLVTAPHESGATLVVSAPTLLTVVIPDGRSAVMYIDENRTPRILEGGTELGFSLGTERIGLLTSRAHHWPIQ